MQAATFNNISTSRHITRNTVNQKLHLVSNYTGAHTEMFLHSQSSPLQCHSWLCDHFSGIQLYDTFDDLYRYCTGASNENVLTYYLRSQQQLFNVRMEIATKSIKAAEISH